MRSQPHHPTNNSDPRFFRKWYSWGELNLRPLDPQWGDIAANRLFGQTFHLRSRHEKSMAYENSLTFFPRTTQVVER